MLIAVEMKHPKQNVDQRYAGPVGDGRFERSFIARAEVIETLTPGHGIVVPNFNLTDKFAQGPALNILWMNRLGPVVEIYHFE